MKTKIATFLICILTFQPFCYATVHYLAVNHYTHQYAFFEDGAITDIYQPIGWTFHGDYFEIKKEIIAAGYQITTFPYLIEVIILALTLTGGFIFYLFQKKLKGFLK